MALSMNLGTSGRIVKRPSTKKQNKDALSPSSSSGVARTPVPNATPKAPKQTTGRKKKSNAGRVEVPVTVVNGKRRYLCPAEPPCDCHFSRKNDAYRHLDDRHGVGLEQYVCGCGRRLSRRDALHRHYTTCQWVKQNRRKESPIDVSEPEEEEEMQERITAKPKEAVASKGKEVVRDEGDDTIKIKVKVEEQEANARQDELMTDQEDEEEDQLVDDD
jgi:uncharacterized Zn-finger protein